MHVYIILLWYWYIVYLWSSLRPSNKNDTWFCGINSCQFTLFWPELGANKVAAHTTVLTDLAKFSLLLDLWKFTCSMYHPMVLYPVLLHHQCLSSPNFFTDLKNRMCCDPRYMSTTCVVWVLALAVHRWTHGWLEPFLWAMPSPEIGIEPLK